MTRLLTTVAAVALIALATAAAQTGSMSTTAPPLDARFESKFADVNGTTLHYVVGGHGPAVILLHGFPEDWYEFRKIMPALATQFTVIAVDLRGVGGSRVTPTGYDAATLAEDIHQLADHLRLDRPYVFGHDIGGLVAYALARRYPRTLRGAMLLDIGFPGMDPWEQIQSGPHFWHVRFHQTTLPEKLIAGRQNVYFRYFLSPDHFSDADLAHYSDSYEGEHLRTAFEFYRSFPETAKFNAAQRENIDLPFIIGSGERDAFAPFVPQIAEAMRAHGCSNVRTTFVPNSAHYVAEEQPDAVAKLILQYAR